MSAREQLPGVIPFGGISQQPPHAALPTQSKDIVNMIPDVAVGLRKRPGTVFERKFTEAPKADLRQESWSYSTAEKYRVVFGLAESAAILRIFRVGGGEASVAISSDARDYLEAGAPTAADLKFVAVQDFALLVNSRVGLSLVSSDSYVSFGDRSEYEAAIALTLGAGDRVRVLNDSAGGESGYYQYQPGSLTFGHMNFPVVTSPWSISGGYWDDSGYFPCGFRIAFRRVSLTAFSGYDWDHTTRNLGKTGGGLFASYTFRAGDQIFISAGTGFTVARWYEIESKISNDFIRLKTQAGTSGASQTDLASNDGSGVAPIGIEVEVNLDLSQQSPAQKNMDWVASQIQNALRAGGAANALCAWVPQKVGGSFQITGPYRGSQSRVYTPTAPTQTVGASGDLRASGAPFDSAVAVGVAGTGTLGSESDTSTPESRWIRTAPPNQASAKFDPETIPVKISRTAPDTFTVELSEWKQRASGDQATNPGIKIATDSLGINHAVWFKERLVLGGGSYIAASRVGDPTDFWVEDVTEVVDSDPISKTIPNPKAGPVRFFSEFATSLVVFCSQQQYEFTSADQPLTPQTAQLIASTTYSILNVEPKRGTTQVYFAAPAGKYAVVAEYFQDPLRVSPEAAEVTAHVPKLVSSGIRSIVPMSGSNAVLFPVADSATIYCYRYFFEGSEKQQSAWSKFVFGYGTYRICDVAEMDGVAAILNENAVPQAINTGACRLTLPSHGYSNGDEIFLSESTTVPSVDGTKYVKVIDTNTVEIYTDSGLLSVITITTAGTARWHSGVYVIETLSLEDPEDDGFVSGVYMDRKLYLTGVHSAGVTTFTLPNAPSVASGSAQFSGFGSTLNKVVLGNSFGSSAGNVLSISAYGTTFVQVVGNYSAGPCALGSYFLHSVVPFRPFLRDNRGRADIRKNLLVASLAIAYYLSCSIRVKAEQLNSVTRERGGSFGATPQTGTLESWLSGDPSNVTWTIDDYSTSDATRPLTISALHWDVEYSPEGGTDGL